MRYPTGFRRPAPLLAAAAAVALLAPLQGCSDSGGTDLRSDDIPDVPRFARAPEPSAPFAAEDWSESAEYRNSTGLAAINAAEGYARRTAGRPGGAGVSVAIIDGGADLTHPDLGNLEKSFNFDMEGAPAASVHGTHVTGIVGAARTRTGRPGDMHGVAYNADLINIQATRPRVSGGEVDFIGFDPVDVAYAIGSAAGVKRQYAGDCLRDERGACRVNDLGAPRDRLSNPDAEADIMNLSLGGPSDGDGVPLEAMRHAADRDKVMVIAAGNEGLPNPTFPARFAPDPSVDDHTIVVGALAGNNLDPAEFTNLCGVAAEQCLFAPGTDINSTLPGEGYGLLSGTSMATPYVAGAAAVVKAAFPGISGSDVVDRLLRTADDLGADDPGVPDGVDPVYGRGRLNLEAAMAPVGELGVPVAASVEGGREPLAASTLSLGPGFGFAAARGGALARAMAVDEMNFPFAVDLAAGVEVRSRPSGLAAFVGVGEGDGALTAIEPTPLGSIAAAADARDDAFGFAQDPFAGAGPDRRRQGAPTVRFTSADIGLGGAGVGAFMSLNGSSATDAGLGLALHRREGAFFEPTSFLAPFDGLAGATSGGGVSFAATDSTSLSFSAFTSSDDGPTGATLEKVELTHTTVGDVELRVGYGWLAERDGFLGSESDGAFGVEASGRSQYVNLSVLAPLADGLSLFGTYTHGRAEPSVQGGLLRDWSTARADAFGLGMVVEDVAEQGDSLSVMVGQPLRVSDAEATATVPVAREPDGTVRTESERVDLSPAGREIATEAVYRFALDGDRSLATGAFVRLNPDHDPEASPDVGLGVRYAVRF